MSEWQREKEQETRPVYRWFERGLDDLISLVEGNHPRELDLRVSIGGKSFHIPGSKEILLTHSDEQLIKRAERAAKDAADGVLP